MRWLVACEYSGRVRDALVAQGHDAYSCDFHPSERPSPRHIQGDVRPLLAEKWDGLIAHPDCTFHTLASVRWFTTIPARPAPGIFYGDARWDQWELAVEFFSLLQAQHHIPRIVIENPLMHGCSLAAVGRYSQIVHPWQFGHKELKSTCLWIKGLPLLTATDNVGPPPRDPVERRTWAVVHRMPPGPDRWKERSRTYQGIADAMAAQWGSCAHS